MNAKNYAIRFYQPGGPEVLKYEELPLEEPKPGEVLIRHHAIGVNYLDTLHRSGFYPLPLPSLIGSEGAGVVESVGPAASVFKVGDRVTYAGGPLGSYAKYRVLAEKHLVKIPDAISFDEAAALSLKGLTVEYLLNRTYSVKRDEKILFHSAAGGVGLIACQWARALGAQLIGVVSSDEKAKQALENGAWAVINSKKEDILKRVLELTKGEKVNVVYDPVGKDTWETSIECLRPRGLMVSFGTASGAVAPIEVALLQKKGSLYLTRPTLGNYISDRTELEAAAQNLFNLVIDKKIKVHFHKRYPLAQAAVAHADLGARKTSGALLLIPE